MKYLFHLYFSGFLLLCGLIFKTQALCPQPDVPTNGKYTPQQKKFELGDEIIYSCRKGFSLAGKERRTCKMNGVWSDHTPFCDPSVSLSDPSITNKGAIPTTLFRVLDGNSNTCFDWYNATGEHLYVHLEKKIVIRVVRIFLKKGITSIQILTGLNNNMKLCESYKNFIETDRWVHIKCRSNVLADTMKILVTETRFISVCEIEVYGKEDESCERSPTMIIPYGHFEVSRTKAMLICEEGYKSENNRLACEGNNSWIGGRLRCEEILCDSMPFTGISGGEWTFPVGTQKLSAGAKMELKCNTGYRQSGSPVTVVCGRNGTWSKTNATCVADGNSKESTRAIIFGSVGIFVVLLIIALLATTIHFIRKQRNKEVVVVYQTQPDGSVRLSESEMEYSSPFYEQLKPRPPEPPSTPRPMAKLSTMSRGGNRHSGGWKNILKNQPVPPDLTHGTMKSSTIYGS